MTTTAWRAPARLSVSGPDGWAAAERIEVHHRDGDALVAVESWPVAPGADLEELARVHAGRRGAGPDAPFSPAEVLGEPGGLSTTLSRTDDQGRTVAVSVGYALRGHRMYAVTEVAPEGDARKTADVATILASVSVAGPSDVDVEQLPLRPADGHELASVASAWLDAGIPPGVTEHVLTTEEAFGAARHFGVTMLPGTESLEWNRLDDEQRALASAVGWRSLVARGGLDEPALREALEVAASHDALVVLTTRSASGSDVEWFAVRPDRCARVRRGADPGTVRISGLDTTALADLVLGQEGATDDLLTASCVYRQDGRVVGREATWRRDDPPQQVRQSLAGLLPGPSPEDG
jgi:hypothetical protein